jgi:hypothetical protein
MQLLDVVADQALMSSLSRFVFETQMACQAYCESEAARSTEENH